MPPSPVERSLSLTDVEALTRHCHRVLLPFDLSATVGYGDKKDIFKIVTPKRKIKRHRSVGQYSTRSLRTTKNSERVSSAKINLKSDATIASHSLLGSNQGFEFKEKRVIPATSKDIKPPARRPRAKTFPSPKRSTSEDKTCILRNTKSLTHLPHLKLCLGPRDPAYNRMESDVVVKFPEKSVLLLAQDDDDQILMKLSSSSVVAPYSQQNVTRRIDDSGVQISDGAVLTWTSDVNVASKPSIPSSGTLFPNQAPTRRVTTKSSLQSNYIPSLEKLMEEPLLSPKACKHQFSNGVSSASAGTNERKDMAEVVVSHWTRMEQQGSESRLATHQSCSFENRARSSSLSLVNEVAEEVLFRRSSTNISETEFEQQSKEKTKQRRVTIATENPVNELSAHYATKLEKEAFRKIKEWKEGFAIKLDQVLKQRRLHIQDCNTEITHGDKFANVSYMQPVLSYNQYSIHSLSNTSRPPDVQRELLIELKRVSEIQVKGMGDSNGCDTGSRILQEIKKQRRSSKGLGENKKMMEDLSSWHRQETGRITSDLIMSPLTPDVQNVRGLLSSLKETIDTIFTTTLVRVDDLIRSSTMLNKSHIETTNGTYYEETILRSQIKRVTEERGRLLMENGSLKRQVADLQRMFDEAQKGTVNLTATESYDFVEFAGHNIIGNVEHYQTTKYVQEMIGIKEYIDLSSMYELVLQEMDKRTAMSNEPRSEEETFDPLWYRQAIAEAEIIRQQPQSSSDTHVFLGNFPSLVIKSSTFV